MGCRIGYANEDGGRERVVRAVVMRLFTVVEEMCELFAVRCRNSLCLLGGKEGRRDQDLQ